MPDHRRLLALLSSLPYMVLIMDPFQGISQGTEMSRARMWPIRRRKLSQTSKALDVTMKSLDARCWSKGRAITHFAGRLCTSSSSDFVILYITIVRCIMVDYRTESLQLLTSIFTTNHGTQRNNASRSLSRRLQHLHHRHADTRTSEFNRCHRSHHCVSNLRLRSALLPSGNGLSGTANAHWPRGYWLHRLGRRRCPNSPSRRLRCYPRQRR